MTDPITAVPSPSGWRGVVARTAMAALRATLKVSPRPTAWVIRRQFAANGRRMAASLDAHAPAGVAVLIDEAYGDQPDMRLDVYRPAAADGAALATVVWTHGGAFVGGAKDEIAGYLRMIAATGFTVVGIDYSLAPRAKHPTPVRQLMAALAHVQHHADRLNIDVHRMVLAGDSAGAHVAAQATAIAADAAYGADLGVTSTITPDQLRGVALCCGLFDFTLLDRDSPLRDFIVAVGWSYSGSRDFRNDRRFVGATTLTRHVSDAFPPVFITAGNADPLFPQSRAFAAALEAEGVDVDTLFYPADHQPPLGHEYQFDMTLADGAGARERLIAFFRRCT